MVSCRWQSARPVRAILRRVIIVLIREWRYPQTVSRNKVTSWSPSFPGIPPVDGDGIPSDCYQQACGADQQGVIDAIALTGGPEGRPIDREQIRAKCAGIDGRVDPSPPSPPPKNYYFKKTIRPSRSPTTAPRGGKKSGKKGGARGGKKGAKKSDKKGQYYDYGYKPSFIPAGSGKKRGKKGGDYYDYGYKPSFIPAGGKKGGKKTGQYSAAPSAAPSRDDYDYGGGFY